MSRYNTLLFDLDGTLTDSAPGIIKCFRYALETMGFDEPDDIMRIVGPPIYDSFAQFCGMNEEQVQEAARIYRSRYSEKGLFENEVYKGVPEMLKRLKDGGKRLLVATSKPEVFAVRILEKFQLAEYFDVIGGADINGSRNDKNEIIEYVLERAGVTDRRTALMAGDRSYDVRGAHKTGLECMGVLWGYGSEEELKASGADYIAASPAEAADMLL